MCTSTAILCEDTETSSQTNLNVLNEVLDLTRSLYLLLRRNNSIFAITFIPYRAAQDEREAYLQYRPDLVKLLGEQHFETSLICKEIGEITDARSWIERQNHREEQDATRHMYLRHDLKEQSGQIVKDLGYRKNKCRLCDRRMKNQINDEASAALSKLEHEGDLVQIVRIALNFIFVLLTASVSGC